MRENRKLLILDIEPPSTDERFGPRIERIKALNALAAAGAKIRHDSGGRLVVIELPEEVSEKAISRLSGSKIVDIHSKENIPNLNESEALFLDAIRIRDSKRYREERSRSLPGETPEEKEFFSAPHTREDF